MSLKLMRAAVFKEYGNPTDELQNMELQLPEPKPGEVRIKLIMSPVHNHDLLLIRGEYGYRPELPMVAGSEGVGTIDKLGAHVEGLKVGQRVAVSDVPGVWAEYFLADQKKIITIPDEVPDDLAAQLLGMPLSAVTALDELDARPRDWIVVNAANGAVGRTIAQIAEARDIHVASIVNRPQAKADLEAEGIGYVFVADADGAWLDQVHRTVDGGRVAGGIDMVSGPMAGQLVNLISQAGTLLSFGAISGLPMQIDPSHLIFKQICVKGFWNAQRQNSLNAEHRLKLIHELVRHAVAGKLKLPVSRAFSLDRAGEAAAASAEKRNGKVMIAARAA